MALFSVVALSPTPPAALASAIAHGFREDFKQVTPYYWLISAKLTAKELSDRLKVTEGAAGSVVVTAVAGYYGRAPNDLWEWIKVKLENPSSG